MNDDERLSRLLEGDLPAAEAEALRARLSAEPALAERYAAMQGMVRALGGLAAELPPPGRPRAFGAATPEKSVRAPATAAGRARPWVFAAVAAAVAAGFTFALRPAPPALAVLTGTTVVTGRSDVLVAGLPLSVDGRVRISVEPPAGGARGSQAELETMDRSHLLSALVGSLVTVTVLEGHAHLAGSSEAAPLTLAAGESTAVTVGGAGRDRSAPAAPKDLAAAQARIHDLEHQLAVAQLSAGLTRGALEAHEGKPQPWPTDAPAAYQPDAFRAKLDAAVRTVPDASVVDVDCDEFPCVVVLATTSEGDNWTDTLRGVHDAMAHDPGFGDVKVTAMAQAVDDGEGTNRLYAFALAPAPTSEALDTRTQVRAKAAMDELAGAHPDAEPAEVERLRTLGYLSE